MTFGTGELLDTIVKRAKLPISMRFDNYFSRFDMRAPKRLHYSFRAADATRAYFDLVSQLQSEPAAVAPRPRTPTAAVAPEVSPIPEAFGAPISAASLILPGAVTSVAVEAQ